MTNIFRLIVGALLLTSAVEAFAGLSVDVMLCEHLENPCGLGVAEPELMWKLSGDRRAECQTAYQVLVADTPAALDGDNGDLWDSGKIVSEETIGIVYGGKPLHSRERCFWKVRVWDRDGKSSNWSKTASWEMGLLEASDWQAKWIARTTNVNVRAAPLLRREFALTGRIKRARAYICGLGNYELYLNGKRIGDHLLDPAFTDYDRRVLYATYDVTGLLKCGENAVGVILGDGWYNAQNKTAWNWDQAPWRAAPKVLLQIEVEFTDGRRMSVVSDRKWKCADSPIVSDMSYSGEIYDARLEKPGWNRTGFDDSGWDQVLKVAPPEGRLVAQAMPAIKVDRVIKAVRITEPKAGIFVFDFGKILAGVAELRVHGPAGTTVTMKYGERLYTNGLLDQTAIAEHTASFDSNQTFQTDCYILKGKGVEEWHSRFTYDGFQYVEVRGFLGKPTVDSLRAESLHSAVPIAGRFECSNPLLNKIWQATRQSYLNNLQGIPTGCSQRERGNGWTGDAQLAAEQGMFNYFPVTVYSKWINDIADAQRPDGIIPSIVPSGGWGFDIGNNGLAWVSAFLLIPYYQYVYYGDTSDFRRHYGAMKKYVDYVTAKATTGIVKMRALDDWEPWKTKTRAALTETSYYYVDARIMALAAGILGKPEDLRKYTDLAQKIKTAFNGKFFDSKTGLYDNGSQTALSCALYQGLVETADRELVLGNLVSAIERSDWHIDTGILGAKYVLNALLENGRADVAYRIVAQKTQPGWGWWIEQGATTLWERWGTGGSHDNIMFGDVSAWFYKALAGINPDPAAPGFKHFFIKPNVVGDLTFARAQYDSIRGKIVSDWKVREGEFQLHVEIPANTTATVSLPVEDARLVLESGKPLVQAPGVRHIRVESGRITYETGSGQYDFDCRK